MSVNAAKLKKGGCRQSLQKPMRSLGWGVFCCHFWVPSEGHAPTIHGRAHVCAKALEGQKQEKQRFEALLKEVGVEWAVSA